MDNNEVYEEIRNDVTLRSRDAETEMEIPLCVLSKLCVRCVKWNIKVYNDAIGNADERIATPLMMNYEIKLVLKKKKMN